MTAPFRVEVLEKHHDRAAFTCGEEALDRYFQTNVTQDVRRRLTHCFVAVESATGTIAGFYTLAATGISLQDLPPEITKRLPRYPTLPAARVGRLAVDRHFRGRGLGGALLADAAHRALSSEVAVHALLVDAKNAEAVAFYRHHGFEPLASLPESLFLPLATAEKALQKPTMK